MIIETLLGDIPATEFLGQFYLKLPFARPGGCAAFCTFADWVALDKLLQCEGADVVVGKQHDGRSGRPRNAEEAADLLDQGFTIGVRHAERHSRELAALAERFASDFRSPVDVHVYCTPAGNSGFGWHYDAEEVFVLQCEGAKTWELRKNTVNPWPTLETLPKNMRYEREIMPVIRCNLVAGDWLYIPSGYWHRTEATSRSISISVGLLAATGIDIYDFLRSRLLTSLRWRQRLPCHEPASSADEAVIREQFQEICRGLAEDVAAELQNDALQQSFLNSRVAEKSGGDSQHQTSH